MSSQASRPHVVIVEDEAIVALELQSCLSKLGYVVAGTTGSGLEALRLVEEHQPDLVIADLLLEGDVDGIELARLIEKRCPTPVIYVTGHSDAGTLERVKATNQYGYVVKPFDYRQLDAVLQLALARREREDERRRIELKKLQEARRMAELKLRDFTHSAGHDLRDPLHTTNSLLQLLASQVSSKLDAHDYELLSDAQTSLQRMDILLQDLIEFAGGAPSGAPATVISAHAALGWALQNLQTAIAESHAVITYDPLPHVVAHFSQLGQVFQNLIGNAIKYRRSGANPKLHVGAERGEGEWLFFVKDHGIGFDRRHAERIFLPFRRLHNQQEYPGSGMGLAICKKIVEAHGGRMWAESIQGEGATFYFSIPGSAVSAVSAG